MNTLAARKGSAQALLAAVEAGKLPRGDLTADLVRQLRNLKDPSLDARIGQVWGTVRETTGDRARLIARYKAMLKSKPAHAPDLAQGRAVFAKVCQQCHTLFGVGRQVGPDLTGSNRADLDYLLSNVLDPSALIGKDYLAHVIATTDGRVLTGIIRAEDKDTITLMTANETITLPKSEVERAESQRAIDDAGRPLESPLGAGNPLAGRVPRQPGAGGVAGGGGWREVLLDRMVQRAIAQPKERSLSSVHCRRMTSDDRNHWTDGGCHGIGRADHTLYAGAISRDGAEGRLQERV